jgi:hypothetical protein
MGPKRKKRKRIEEEQSDGAGHRYSTRHQRKKTLSKSPTTPLKKPVSSNEVTEPQKYVKLSLTPKLSTVPVNSQPSHSKQDNSDPVSKYFKLSFKRKSNTPDSDSQPSKYVKGESSSTSTPKKKPILQSKNVTPRPKGPLGSPVKTPPLKGKSGKGGPFDDRLHKGGPSKGGPFKGKSGKGGPFKGQSGKGDPFKGQSGKGDPLNKSKQTTSSSSDDGVYDPFAALRADITDLNVATPPSSPPNPTHAEGVGRDEQPLPDPTKPSTLGESQNIQQPPPEQAEAEKPYKLYEFKRRIVEKYGVA